MREREREAGREREREREREIGRERVWFNWEKKKKGVWEKE